MYIVYVYIYIYIYTIYTQTHSEQRARVEPSAHKRKPAANILEHDLSSEICIAHCPLHV